MRDNHSPHGPGCNQCHHNHKEGMYVELLVSTTQGKTISTSSIYMNFKAEQDYLNMQAILEGAE